MRPTFKKVGFVVGREMPGGTISEEKPGGEEVKEKKEEENASKLMWKSQKMDPDNLDHHIVNC